MPDSRQRLLETIRTSIIGDDHTIDGPFGPRRVTYADYTASGRALSFVEDFIRREVLPLYANTHTETSGTGLQTTRFREDARRVILDCVGGGEDDVVIFCGSGATGAIHRLIEILNLHIPHELDDRYRLSDRIPENERPVVFIGPYEHHSNELPWRESIADVVVIDEDSDGQIDLGRLEDKLELHRKRGLLIGSFSAASNVTGIESKTAAITALLHRYGALSFWDYAAAAPYLEIDMNPDANEGREPVSSDTRDRFDRLYRLDRHMASMDAVFLSPHKLVGGPGTPGVLVVKRELLQNRVPSVPGGGTVRYVNELEHRYIEDPASREEGGTPAIIESIRAGLVFQLKQAVGVETIQRLEEGFIQRAIASWDANPNIRILGSKTAPRLSIVSFLIRHGDGYLHHNFVVALLNDLFGIQTRGGCSCAGPYGHRLLGIDLPTSHEFECSILKGHEGVKPGWVRINFNYFISEKVFDFLLRAVHLVAENGWKLVPQYRMDPSTGIWRHASRRPRASRRLGDISYVRGEMGYASHHVTAPESALADYLVEAERLLDPTCNGTEVARPSSESLAEDFEHLRWFPLPSEIWAELHGESKAPPASDLIHLR